MINLFINKLMIKKFINKEIKKTNPIDFLKVPSILNWNKLLKK